MAQSIRKPVRVLTTRDGLPQSFVSGLIQDADGFVWVGTRNGLARYDSRQFMAFHHNRRDSTTLSSDVLISLVNDSNGHIWIEHESGDLDMLSPKTQHIERIGQRPLFRQHPLHFARRGWTVDGQGRLWGTQLTAGLWCYDWTRQHLRQYTRQRNELASDTIRGLLASRKGGFLWLISRSQLSRLDPATGKVQSRSLPVPLDVEHLPIIAGGTVHLHERRNGEVMWVDGGRLVVFTPTTGLFRLFPLPLASSAGLSWFYTSPDGQDYLTAVDRLYRYDDRRGLVVIGELNLPGQRSESLLVDQSGMIWMGTNAAGIQQIDPAGPYFDARPNILGFHPDLFAQQFGLSLAQTFDWPTTDDGFRRLSYYLRSTYDAQNRLWVGLRYWAGYYDSTQRRLVLMPPIPTLKSTPYRRLGISGMRFDSDGRLWTVDSDGYVAFLDSGHHQWTPWLPADALQRVVTVTDVSPQDLVVDEQAIWIASQRNGLIRIDRQTRKVRLFNQTTPGKQLPSSQLLGLQPDPTQPRWLWIGSYDGLIRFDKHTGQSQLYTTAEGLPDNTIYSLVEDDGYLWLTTNKGLCRFHPQTHQIRMMNTTDGIPGDEFNRFHHLRLPDGRLAFGGTEGWTLFDPRSVHDDSFQPPVALTELKVNNQLVPITPGHGLLPLPLNILHELVVPYRQNTLSLSFAGLQYNQPTKLHYRYQLEGYDGDWVLAGFSPTATYTQLPPGHYTLRVSATNTTGQWSPHVHTLAITVTPPWWRTNLAYLLYFGLALVLLRGYVRYRMKRDREQQQQQIQQREADQLREVNAMKTRFFADITHEFRTPLTLILTPVEALGRELGQTPYAERLTLIERNAHQLLGLINQLMDLARLDAQLMTVTTVLGRPDEVVANLTQSFIETAAAKNIQLVCQLDETGTYWFDPDKLERIVTNLLANALKFTPSTPANPGTVTLTLRTADGQARPGLQLSVADTGIGIPAEALPHLFDRFYRVNPLDSRADRPYWQPGTGIGLALVKELVDLQEGHIRVESQPGQGTTFWLYLPYQPAPDSPAVAESVSEAPVPEGHPSQDNESETALILLVEDNEDMAQFITRSLPPVYQICRAVDGQDGLEQARQLMPDLIISDVMMPRLNGYELCQRLKTDPRTDHIPVLMLTAKVTLANRLEGLSVGADDYLAKPFHVAELQLRIHNQLQQRRRLREQIHQQLLSDASPGPPRGGEHIFLARLYAQLDARLTDAQFGIEQLADELGLSRSQFHRKIKALTDIPPSELVRTYRLNRATDYLRRGYNSSETAYQVGFDSPAYFARCFREQYGLSPSEYAQKNRN